MDQFHHFNEYGCGMVRQKGDGVECRIQICRTQQGNLLDLCSICLLHLDFTDEVIEEKTAAAEMLPKLCSQTFLCCPQTYSSPKKAI